MRVFLDANVLVSALATRGICADILQVVLAEHQLVLGETVLGELKRVLSEKMHVPEGAVSEAEALLRREAVVVSQPGHLAFELRDPDDVPILAEAMESLAEVLVTGDRDFLDVADRLPVLALSPRQFWEKLQEGGESDPS